MVSIHAPARGATGLKPSVQFLRIVSIHAPARRPFMETKTTVSIHAARGRPLSVVRRFNPRRARRAVPYWTVGVGFNPRPRGATSPRAAGDSRVSSRPARIPRYDNPRPRGGATIPVHDPRHSANHAPATRRLRPQPELRVSITPRGELLKKAFLAVRVFNPRPGATVAPEGVMRLKKLNPRPARGPHGGRSRPNTPGVARAATVVDSG